MSTEPSFAEWVCLALVTQKVSHGWAVGTMLAPDGEVGRIWTLSRPLTYRAIDGLVDQGLIARTGHAAGRGRHRVNLAATARGRRRVRRWLDQPVEHLRDVRTELLVKLHLRRRSGLDNADLLSRQQEVFAPTIDVLTANHPDDDLVALWRRESARAVRRFLDQALDPGRAGSGSDPHPDSASGSVPGSGSASGSVPGSGSGEGARAAGTVRTAQPDLRLSARNQLVGTVRAVHQGDVMATVNAVLGDGRPLTAAITREAATELDLAPGDHVVLLIKATDVIVATTR